MANDAGERRQRNTRNKGKVTTTAKEQQNSDDKAKEWRQQTHIGNKT
jgi:hypothetical protein